MTSIVLAGCPRSGTTWVARALAAHGAGTLVHEPDNEQSQPFAARAKRALGRYPLLTADDAAPDLLRLWRGAMGEPVRGPLGWQRLAERLYGDPNVEVIPGFTSGSSRARRLRIAAGVRCARPHVYPGPPPRLVKTVFSSLALDWLAANVAASVVLVQKDPANLVASWAHRRWLPPFDNGPLTAGAARLRELASRFGAPPPPEGNEYLDRLTWQLLLLRSAESAAARAHPEWLVISHEAVCDEPVARLRTVAERLGLPWNVASERFVRASNAADGDTFSTVRAAAAERHRFTERLTATELAVVRAHIEQFERRGRVG